MPEAREQRLAEKAALRESTAAVKAAGLGKGVVASPSRRKTSLAATDDDRRDDEGDDEGEGEGGGEGGGARRRAAGPDTGGWVAIHKGDNKAFFSNLGCKRDELKLSGKVLA